MQTTPIIITTDAQLTTLVADLAQKQLVIQAASHKVKATVESAKQAYEEATRDLAAEINAGLHAIYSYCEQHKDRLFPIKSNGDRQKTLQILQHKLQFRSSSEVAAPEDVITRIRNRLSDLVIQSRSITPVADLAAIEEEIELLNSLIRIPEPELNKDAAGEALKRDSAKEKLAAIGVTRQTNESFTLKFTFTPDT